MAQLVLEFHLSCENYELALLALVWKSNPYLHQAGNVKPAPFISPFEQNKNETKYRKMFLKKTREPEVYPFLVLIIGIVLKIVPWENNF